MNGRRRAVGFALVATGLVAAGLSALTAGLIRPAAADGGLAGYDLSADARGLDVFTLLPTQVIQPELDIPQASATLSSGTGYALASAAWPGPTVANGGSVIGLAVPGFPPKVAALLFWPVRAESRTGQDPPTTEYNVPGLSMRARADNISAEADAGAQGTNVVPGAFGVSHATSTTRASDTQAKSTARSVVENLTIGALHIDQVVSTATATSDGTTGTGTASTVVTGASLAGQPVTIDGNGIHVGTTKAPIDAIVSQVSDQVLSRAGIEVTTGPALHEIEGARSTMSATSIIITLKRNGNTYGVMLGGARASAIAASGDSFSGDVLGGTQDLTGGVSDLGNLGGFSSPTDVGASDLTSSPSVGASPSVDLAPTTAAAKGRPLSPAAMLLGLAAALLFAVGMRRLNTAALSDHTAGVACKLPGEDP